MTGVEANIYGAMLIVTTSYNAWARRRSAMLFLYRIGFLVLKQDFYKDDCNAEERDIHLRINNPALYKVFVNSDLCREIVQFL